MSLGEKLWEDHGRVTARSVKSAKHDDIVMEISTAGEFKGFGRAKGIDGKFVATGNVERDGNLRRTTFHEVFTTSNGETILIHGYQLGKIEEGRAKSVAALSFSTKSAKLAWVNDLMLIRETDNDANSEEFVGRLYQWI